MNGNVTTDITFFYIEIKYVEFNSMHFKNKLAST